MTNLSNNVLNVANQAEILRSHQRDNDLISQLNESITDILHRYNLQRRFSRFLKSEISAKLLYFIFTSGLGNQTFGEEYTGIVQANLQTKKIPSLMVRTFAAILECFGEQMLLKLIDKLLFNVNKSNNELTPQAKSFFNFTLKKMRMMLPVLIVVHRGLFYIYGKYYSIGRRIAGIDYIKVYGSRPHSSVSWGLRMLGCVTIAQCVFKLWQYKDFTEEIVIQEKELDGSSSNRCQLCLEKVPDTATPCGHLFCWSCVAEWLKMRKRCPLCRESVAPSRIIPLINL